MAISSGVKHTDLTLGYGRSIDGQSSEFGTTIHGGQMDVEGNIPEGPLLYTRLSIYETVPFGTGGETDSRVENEEGETTSNMGSISGRSGAEARLSETFGLPLPDEFETSSAHEWSEDSLSFGDKMTRLALTTQDLAELANLPNNIWGLFRNTVTGKIQRSLPGTSQSFGYVYNPYKEVLYEGVRIRTFQFNWTLYPRNQGESQMIQRFIRQMEFHARPSLADDTEFSSFRLPALFEISFPTLKLPKITRLACTQFDVDYTPEGPKFQYDGYPSFYRIQTSWTELFPLVRQNIETLYGSVE